MNNPWIISAKQNIAVVDTLPEVYRFLKELQKRGITQAKLIGTDMSVHLNEHNFWIWRQP
jgi:hypothetical protein